MSLSTKFRFHLSQPVKLDTSLVVGMQECRHVISLSVVSVGSENTSLHLQSQFSSFWPAADAELPAIETTSWLELFSLCSPCWIVSTATAARCHQNRIQHFMELRSALCFMWAAVQSYSFISVQSNKQTNKQRPWVCRSNSPSKHVVCLSCILSPFINFDVIPLVFLWCWQGTFTQRISRVLGR